ncbi:uncharacterized protein UDID_07521 [Ustilago sp. UG-2017a]|nr:uncharacterized protein UDID_07521 [Ustilago sp. UG-2017a]
MNKNALSALSMLLLALTWAVVGSLAAPFGLEDKSDAASELRQRKGSSPRSPLPISASHEMAISQPIYMKDLSAEELFKALVLLESQRTKLEATSMAHASIFRSSISDFLDQPPFTTREHLFRFDKTRPPVSLPIEAKDWHRLFQDYVINKYYLALNQNHYMSSYKGGDVELAQTGASKDWMSAVTGRTRQITSSQVVKEGLTAAIRTREWADKIRSQHPEMLPKDAVEAALRKVSGLWHNGMMIASGYAYIPVQEIAAKIHRR